MPAQIQPEKVFICLMWFVMYVGPVIVLAALIWSYDMEVPAYSAEALIADRFLTDN